MQFLNQSLSNIKMKQILSKYNMDKIKIMIIDSIDYGLMNGEKVLTDALNL